MTVLTKKVRSEREFWREGVAVHSLDFVRAELLVYYRPDNVVTLHCQAAAEKDLGKWTELGRGRENGWARDLWASFPPILISIPSSCVVCDGSLSNLLALFAQECEYTAQSRGNCAHTRLPTKAGGTLGKNPWITNTN